MPLTKRGWSCVGYYEIDKYCVQTYNKNFKTSYNPTDITKVRGDDIADHTLLCAGFPCQSFSIAGKRRGFQDTRGTLFFEIARILKAKRPNYFILENVKGLLNHDKGETFKIILQTLDELGYEYQWMVLNSKFFGVPQNRERVFIIGNTRGTSRPEILPFRGINKENNELQRYEETTNTIHTRITADSNGTYIEGRGQTQMNDLKIGVAIQGSQAQRVYTTDLAPTLKGLGGGQGAKTGLYMIDNPLKGKTQFGWHFEQNVYSEESEIRSLKSSEGSGNKPKVISNTKNNLVMNTLTEATGNRAGSSKEFMRGVNNINNSIGQIRRLTPTECERLQGFPDNFTQGVSDTQRYKQCGNAVTTKVVEEEKLDTQR